jgi:hypothetical protein
MSAAIVRTVDRVQPSAELVRAISYWERDAAAVQSGLIALERLSILIPVAGLSDIAEESAVRWIDEAREALERFQTLSGSGA